MLLAVDSTWVVAFDLDDTLYPEIDFVYSGLRAVAQALRRDGDTDHFAELEDIFRRGQPVFDTLARRQPLRLSVTDMVHIYRCHVPSLNLRPSTGALLQGIEDAGAALALITDGRSITQRNKMKALGVEARFHAVMISAETGHAKPNLFNFTAVAQALPAKHYVYIADNLHKDFVAPQALGWQCICVRDVGQHIHPHTPELIANAHGIEFVDSVDALKIIRAAAHTPQPKAFKSR